MIYYNVKQDYESANELTTTDLDILADSLSDYLYYNDDTFTGNANTIYKALSAMKLNETRRFWDITVTVTQN